MYSIYQTVQKLLYFICCYDDYQGVVFNLSHWCKKHSVLQLIPPEPIRSLQPDITEDGRQEVNTDHKALSVPILLLNWDLRQNKQGSKPMIISLLEYCAG